MNSVHFSRATLAVYLAALGSVSPSILQVFGPTKGAVIVGVIGILGALMSVQQPVQGNRTNDPDNDGDDDNGGGPGGAVVKPSNNKAA